jgi:hypothetical protein
MKKYPMRPQNNSKYMSRLTIQKTHDTTTSLFQLSLTFGGPARYAASETRAFLIGIYSQGDLRRNLCEPSHMSFCQKI